MVTAGGGSGSGNSSEGSELHALKTVECRTVGGMVNAEEDMDKLASSSFVIVDSAAPASGNKVAEHGGQSARSDATISIMAVTKFSASSAGVHVRCASSQTLVKTSRSCSASDDGNDSKAAWPESVMGKDGL